VLEKCNESADQSNENKIDASDREICTHGPTYLEIGSYKIGTVRSFTFLGSEVNYKNDNSVDIQKRILSANRRFHGLRQHLKSHLISRKTKTLMYKVLVRPVLTYASETWTLSKTDERLLSVFERRILRYIFGTVQENGVWRKRHNHELYELFTEPDIVKYIEINRLGWAGQDMLYIWIITKQLRKYLTPSQQK
jgi:hypothetical protein